MILRFLLKIILYIMLHILLDSLPVIPLQIFRDFIFQLGVAAVNGGAQRRLYWFSISEFLEKLREIGHSVIGADAFYRRQGLGISHRGFLLAIRMKRAFKLVERNLPSGGIESGQSRPEYGD